MESTQELFYETVLLEAGKSKYNRYIGKTKYLEEAEILLGSLVQPVATSSNSLRKQVEEEIRGLAVSIATANKLSTSTLLRKVNELLTKQFGFKELTVVVVPGSNGMTPVRSSVIRDFLFKTPSFLHSDGEFYDSSHKMTGIIVLGSDFFLGAYTGGEILGVILHEIGHMFDISFTTYIDDIFMMPYRIYQDLKLEGQGRLSDILEHIGMMHIGAEVLTRLGKPFQWICDNFPAIVQISYMVYGVYDFYNNWKSTIQTYVLEFMTHARNLLFLIQNTGKALKKIFKFDMATVDSALNFNRERFSDSFATVYGYGPDLMNALNKMDTSMAIIFDNPLLNQLTFIPYMSSTIVNMFTDPHPESQTRLVIILEDLKKLSENQTLPPGMRKAIKKQYDEGKSIYKNYIDCDGDTKSKLALHYSRWLKDKIFRGKIDVRSYIFRSSAITGKLIMDKKGAK